MVNKIVKVILVTALAALISFGALSACTNGGRSYSESFDASASGSALPAGWSFDSYMNAAGTVVSSAEVTVLDNSPDNGVLHISCASNDDAKVLRTVDVKTDTVYRISCRVRTQDVVCDDPGNSGEPAGANIALMGDIIARSSGVFGTSDWQTVELVGKTSSHQKQLTVSCRIGGYSSVARGEAWFDDFTVEELPGYKGEYINFFTSQTDTTTGGSSSTALVILVCILIDLAVLVVICGVAMLLAAAIRNFDRDDENDLRSARGRRFARNNAEREEARLRRLSAIRGRNFWHTENGMPEPSDNKLHFKKIDWIFVSALTAVYAVVALFRLGTLSFPTSSWSADKGATVRITFTEPSQIKEVWQNSGVCHCDYTLTADNGEVFSLSKTNDYGYMFKWQKLDGSALEAATTGVTLSVNGGDAGRPREADLTLNELVFFNENGEVIPYTVGDASAAALGDEQDTVPDHSYYYNSMYFDEVYHARTAYEHLHNLKVYEWTHPPLGKLIISIGIMIFGMKPFGWRFMGTFFGILMVPLMYCFAKRIVKKPKLSLLASTLFAFDFMHYTQTRIATVDTYALFFTLLMTYYMFRFLRTTIADSAGKMMKPLALSGLFFGLGCASKWTCIYTGAALAVLFFAKLVLLFIQSVKTAKDPEHSGAVGSFWMRTGLLCAWCVLFFIVIPVIIYASSYCRYYTAEWEPNAKQAIWSADSAHERGATAEEVELTLNEKLNTYFNGVKQNQLDMYNYHSKLDSEHSASSPWWMWIFNLRPTWFSVSRPTSGVAGTISTFGNPAVWNLCFFGTLAMIAVLIHRRRFTAKAAFLFVCIGAALLPWVLVTRSTYAYHYFSTVPYIILASVYALKYLEDMSDYRTEFCGQSAFATRFVHMLKYGWMFAAVALFALFYPVISGLEVSQAYIEFLQWVPFRKIVRYNADGTYKNTWRIGWTFLGYGD